MNRLMRYVSWVLGVVGILCMSATMTVEAANTKGLQWPPTMLVQEGTSQSIVGTGVAQSVEEGLRQIGIDTHTSYMILDKKDNNYAYARYGEGSLLYGFGPQTEGWQLPSSATGTHYARSMVEDYAKYVQEHQETFTVVVPFREVKPHIYVGEVVVTTWFKQVEYPVHLQIAFVANGTGSPSVRYVLTHVRDEALRKQLQYLL